MLPAIARPLFLGLLAALAARPLLAEVWELTDGPLRYLDELGTLVLVAMCAAIRIRGGGRRLAGERRLLVVVLSFAAVAIISAASNRVPPLIAGLGVADYLKGLSWLFVAATLDGPELRSGLRKQITVVAWLAVAFFIVDFALRCFGFFETQWIRVFGVLLPKAPGLLRHPNTSGLYLTLAVIVGATAGRQRAPALLAQWAVISLGLARMLNLSMVAVLGYLGTARRWLLIPACLSLVFLAGSWTRTSAELGHGMAEFAEREHVPWHFRTFFQGMALDIARDHPVLGVGPGRFGGVISVVRDSPVYERYSVPAVHRRMLKDNRSIDSFYPQLLGELGALGSLLWLSLGGLLAWSCWRRREREPWARAGLLSLVMVAIYCMGAGLNLAAVLAPAMSIVGIGLADPKAEETR